MISLVISSKQSIWTMHEPFLIHVVVENRSNKPVEIITDGGSALFEMEILDFKLEQIRGGERFAIPLIRPRVPIRALSSAKPIRLSPHELWNTTVDFNDWKPVHKEGLAGHSYRLKAIWTAGFSDQDRKHINFEISSNELAIDLRTE